MSTIPLDERRPVLTHGDIEVVPLENNPGFILLCESSKMYVDENTIGSQYNNICQIRNLMGAKASFRLRDTQDVLGVLFLFIGFERTHTGSLLEEMKNLVPEEELEQFLTDPYKVSPRE